MFRQHYEVGLEADCWSWQNWINQSGYGLFRIGSGRHGSRLILAHRAAWVLANQADLGAKSSIDHMSPMNILDPHHLEVVTIQENGRRRLTDGRPLDFIEREVYRLLPLAKPHPVRRPNGEAQRICLCGNVYGSTNISVHIRGHVRGGKRFQPRGPPFGGA